MPPREPSQWGVVPEREAAGKGRSWREAGRGLRTFLPRVSCLESTENICQWKSPCPVQSHSPPHSAL